MKKFLGGMMDMSKGFDVDEIKEVVKNEVMVGCNGVIEQSNKGDSYIVATVGNKIASLPSEIANVVNSVVCDAIDSRLDEKLYGFARILETRMLEIVSNANISEHCNNKEHKEYVGNLYSVKQVAAIVKGKDSPSFSTNINYHLAECGVNNIRINPKKNMFEISEDLSKIDSDFLDMFVIIDKTLTCKESFVEYVKNNESHISDATRRFIELNKPANEIINGYIDSKLEISEYDKQMRVINAIFGFRGGEVGKNRIKCYIAFDKKFNVYTKDVTYRGKYIVKQLGMGRELISVICDKLNITSKEAKSIIKNSNIDACDTCGVFGDLF